MKRWRRRKLFRVTRVEQIQVTFLVEATSALKARHTPTPDGAKRQRIGGTVGEAAEQAARWQGGHGWTINGKPVDYSTADDDLRAIAPIRDQVADSGGRDYSPSTGDIVELQFADPRFR